MERQARATRRRIAKLAYGCGFDCFSEAESGTIGLTQLLNEVPDEDLGEIEDDLKRFEELQGAMRSPN